MKPVFLAALLVASLALVGSAPAVAQAANQSSPQPTAPVTNTTDTPDRSDTTQTERIDGQTVIVESRYVPNASVALITLRSESVQTVTLSDAGRFQQGGKVPVRSVALRGGETTTVELPVTEQDGYVGVAISTENTPLYAEIVQQPSGGGLEILRALGSLQAWIAGLTVAFVWMIVAGWNVLRGEDSRPEVA
ncbi:hypothetical protein [Haloarcula pellucida]|uniref:Uncharacterized protein n=1 Tax=Haloarcula pellucida TaxID=1427151 RepID=A0A830GKY3_9EURY|nr:hypothetical protein [Halomicroarcula pellucida]MBX0348569.1 hypothetical protein [Halomicroarcula pellucida]GGN92792.1 hypothetical protein GCM10009030_17390 [Halomicroarcula pellucida]